MKTLIGTLLCLFLTTPLLAAPLRIVSEEWPPYIFAKDGEIKGSDKEVADILLKQLGYQVSWELMPWRRALHTVQTGAADAVLDISPDAKRLEHFIFPDEPFSTNVTVLFYVSSRPFPFERLEDLRGLTIGVSPGYHYNNEEFMTADYFTREPAPTFESNLLKLVHGRIDMVVISRPAGIHTSKRLGIDDQVSYHSTPLSKGDYFLAFRRAPEFERLGEEFGQALRDFKQTDEYASIQHKYGLGLDGQIIPTAAH